MELNLCMRCMNELPADGTVCPVCGFDASGQEPASHHLPFGSVLAGRYMTGAVLGEGGFGVTYIGYELNLGIRIAIKEFYPYGFVGRDHTQSLSVYSRTNAEDFFAKGKEKFLQEARGIAQFMKLPGIVAVRDFFLENNTAYIVMDYIEGPSLKEYARSLGGKIGASELLEMMRPIVQSLIEVHARGVIHRDISPDNILVDTEGKAWLIDFGAMRDASPDGERTLSVTLKKGYSPEEQYRTHGEQGPWTDVYSMCATLYAMMTGIKPDEPFDRLEEETLKPPRQAGAQVTSQVEETLLKGLAIKRTDRLQSMEELYDGLYTAAASDVHPAEEAPASEPTPAAKGIAETQDVPAEQDARAAQDAAWKAVREVAKAEATRKAESTEKQKKTAGIRFLIFAAFLAALGFFLHREYYNLSLEKTVLYWKSPGSSRAFMIGEEVMGEVKERLSELGCSNLSFSVYGSPVNTYKISTNLSSKSGNGYNATDERLKVRFKRGGHMYEKNLSLAVVRPEIQWRTYFIDVNAKYPVEYKEGEFFVVKNGDYLESSVHRSNNKMVAVLKEGNTTVASAEVPCSEQGLAREFESYWIKRNGLGGYHKESRSISQGLLEIWMKNVGKDDSYVKSAFDSCVNTHKTGNAGWYYNSFTVGAGNQNWDDGLEKTLEVEGSREFLSKASAIGASSVTVYDKKNDIVEHAIVYFIRYW